MFVLGVTGGIGSGKTTVARILARHSARVLDADAIVRELYEGGELVARIVERFGPAVRAADGSVNRPALGAIVFSNPESRQAREDLEAIVHPAVRHRVGQDLEKWRAERFDGLAVVDAALLVEAEPPYPLDALLVVVATEEKRLERLAERGTNRAEAARRMKAQVSEAERIGRADFVIKNNGSMEDLEREVRRVLRELRRDEWARSG